MQPKLSMEQLNSKAIQALEAYEEALKETEGEGEPMEPFIQLCKDGSEFTTYSYHGLLGRLLGAIAKPKVQKVLLEALCEDDIENAVDLLGSFMEFYDRMKGNQYETMLLRADIDINGGYSETELEIIISDTERKMKSIRPRYLAEVA